MENEVVGQLMIGGRVFYAIIVAGLGVIGFLAKKLYSDQAKHAEANLETVRMVTEALNRNTAVLEANTATITKLLDKMGS